MLSFNKWSLAKGPLAEGGNVMIGDVSADRIDLNKLDRKLVVKEISKGLKALSNKFKALTGFPLWGDDLFASNQFLSGSSLHLFNKTISDDLFKKHKPTIGDIDTQVDGNQKEKIRQFLDNLNSNEKVDNLIFVGYKPSGDQFITLWTVPSLNLSVQVDLELVDFSNGKPTPWSQFSHSSAWEDMALGIKGVFQKYLIRALQVKNAKDVIIQPKTTRGKEKIMKKSELAFSLKGLRQRMTPVLDANGKQLFKNNMPVYTEVDSKTAEYITNLDVLFASFFGVKGNPEEVKKMDSFVGFIELMKKYLDKSEQRLVLDGFVDILWGKGAQGIVRGDARADYDTKIIPFMYLQKQLGFDLLKDYDSLITVYYKSYK